VVQLVRVAHRGEGSKAQEPGHRQPSVHHAVVKHHVQRAKQRHADAGAEQPLPRGAGNEEAGEDERHGHRRVGRRERVVGHEAAGFGADALAMVAPVGEPQAAVPHHSMHPRRPRLHQEQHHQR